ILADDPKNPRLLAKVAQLEDQGPVKDSIPEQTLVAASEEELDFAEPEVFETVPTPVESQLFEVSSESIADAAVPEFSAPESYEPISTPFEPQSFEPITEDIADVVKPAFSPSEAVVTSPAEPSV